MKGFSYLKFTCERLQVKDPISYYWSKHTFSLMDM